jgi:hypothetical protein
MQPPMSREQWLIDSHWRGGHTPAEVLRWWSDSEDYAEHVGVRRHYPDVISIGELEPPGPRRPGWLRRLLGR